jgi:tRNA threonylcarbamoyladenosine biosynthesis protein TsaB
MKILAIDQSTAIGSLSLLENTTVLVEIQLSERALRSQEIFAQLANVLSKEAISPSDIDMLAVDLGPGSFSGVRMSIAATTGFALPDKKPVIGIGIGEAIAWDLLPKDDNRTLAVIGDARRKSLWYGLFRREGDSIITVKDYALTTPDGITEAIEGSNIVCSPDWDRIGDLLKEALPLPEIIEGDQVPSSSTIGTLAHGLMHSGIPPRQLQPIYMHPAVAPTS